MNEIEHNYELTYLLFEVSSKPINKLESQEHSRQLHVKISLIPAVSIKETLQQTGIEEVSGIQNP